MLPEANLITQLQRLEVRHEHAHNHLGKEVKKVAKKTQTSQSHQRRIQNLRNEEKKTI